MTAIIAVAPDAPKLYGASLDFWDYKGHEAILAGPYETGKTYTALTKLHLLLCVFPKSRGLMVRKTYKSIKNSAVVTYEKKILPFLPSHPKSQVVKYGGESPEFYGYPNGSRLDVGGMDNADKFLSAEYDFIYVNQAEELQLDDWEKLMGRATGRAGNAPYTQVMADCNPGPPTHWIKQRKTVRLFESRHEDNPILYDHVKGEWTEQGKHSLSILDSLTGVRYKRGRLGLWVASEGQVYEFDPALHVVNGSGMRQDMPRFRTIDFGFTNPFVCQWWTFDYDDRLFMYREIYHTQRTVRRFSEQIKRLSEGERITATICDHDAEDRATLVENGIPTIAADKRLSVGIEKVQERLSKAGDGKPRLYIVQDALVEIDADLVNSHKPTCTEEEFSTYVWPEGASGKSLKEVPVDADNHGMDAMRYMVMYAEAKPRKRASVREY